MAVLYFSSISFSLSVDRLYEWSSIPTKYKHLAPSILEKPKSHHDGIIQMKKKE